MATFSTNAIIKARIAGTFIVLGERTIDNVQGYQVKAVNPNDHTQTFPGELWLPESAFVLDRSGTVEGAGGLSTKSTFCKPGQLMTVAELEAFGSFSHEGFIYQATGKRGNDVATGQESAEYEQVKNRGARVWLRQDGTVTED